MEDELETLEIPMGNGGRLVAIQDGNGITIFVRDKHGFAAQSIVTVQQLSSDEALVYVYANGDIDPDETYGIRIRETEEAV